MNKNFATLFFVIYFLFLPRSSFAYFEVFGIKVPTRLEEIKTIFNRTKVSINNSIVVRLVNKTAEPEIGAKEVVENPKNVVSNQIVNGKEEIRYDDIAYDSEKGPTHETKIIAESQINDALKSVFGKEYQGYSLKYAFVDLVDNGANIRIETNDGKILEMEVILVNNGTEIEITKLVSTGEKTISPIEMALIRQFIKRGPAMVLEYFPEYKDRFRFITINPSKIDIWLTAEKYR